MIATAIFNSVLRYSRIKGERIPSTISEDQQLLQVPGRFLALGMASFTDISKERDEAVSLLYHPSSVHHLGTNNGATLSQQSYRSDNILTANHRDAVGRVAWFQRLRLQVSESRRCSRTGLKRDRIPATRVGATVFLKVSSTLAC
jgi:hypothetical protein